MNTNVTEIRRFSKMGMFLCFEQRKLPYSIGRVNTVPGSQDIEAI